MPYTILQRVLVLGVLTLLCLPASAVDFYDVEILVFRQLNNQGDDEELDVPNIRHLELNLELQDLSSQRSAIPLEPAIEGYLSRSAQRIADSRNYEILFHGRWSQRTSARKTAPYIRIELPAVHESHALTGIFRLFSTDLLYIDTFLRYQPEKQHATHQISESLGRNAGPYYFLKERRRVKFREIHFLDHPKFGVLLTVWPVKLPELPVPIIEPQTAVKTDSSSSQPDPASSSEP
jgi:hypothetical protein